MSAKFLTIILAVTWIIGIASGDLYKPKTHNETMIMLDNFKHNITTMIFVDPATISIQLDEEKAEDLVKSEPGFFGALFSSITNIFSTSEESVGDLIADLSKEGVLVEIDIKNPSLTKVLDMYNIQTTPFVIILKGNKVLYRDVATKKAAEKVQAIRKVVNEERSRDSEEIVEQKSDHNQVVTIAPGKAELKADKNDQFLLGKDQAIESSPSDQGTTIIPLKRTTTVESQSGNKSASEISTAVQPVKSNVEFVKPELARPEPAKPELRRTVKASSETSKTETVVVTPQRRPLKDELKMNMTAFTQSSEISVAPAADSVWPVLTETFVSDEYKPIPQIIDENTDAMLEITGKFENDTECVPQTPYHTGFEIDTKWREVLKDEEQMIQEINKLYEDDEKLSQAFSKSEREIHESEELFYKAKNAIDKSLMDSEQMMRQYEMELDRLYNARQAAKKARQDLYHSCEDCGIMKEGVVQQRLNGPYTIIRRPGSAPPSEKKNFHEMLDGTRNSSANVPKAADRV